jgi:hypothetical protein
MRGISNIFLCGVEADPGRFALMEQDLKDNGLNPTDHDLIMAGGVRRQLLLWIDDNYFSLSTTITFES